MNRSTHGQVNRAVRIIAWIHTWFIFHDRYMKFRVGTWRIGRQFKVQYIVADRIAVGCGGR